jgi:hypothetical protein
MILDYEVRSKEGMLLVAKGQEITHALRLKLDNYAKAGLIDREVMVHVPQFFHYRKRGALLPAT